MKRFRKYILAMIFFVMFLGAYTFSGIVSKGQDGELGVQAATISDLTNKLAIKEAAVSKSQKDVLLNASGLNFDRVSKDKTIAEKFLGELLTWKTYDEYTASRNMLLQTYGVNKEDNLVKKFMPAIEKPLFTTQNLKYESVDMYVTGISGSSYTYFAVVKVSSKDKKGSEAYGSIGFVYTIDSDGGISKISAHTLVR